MMALSVAVEASCRDVFLFVLAAVAGGQKMFCGDL